MSVGLRIDLLAGIRPPRPRPQLRSSGLRGVRKIAPPPGPRNAFRRYSPGVLLHEVEPAAERTASASLIGLTSRTRSVLHWAGAALKAGTLHARRADQAPKACSGGHGPTIRTLGVQASWQASRPGRPAARRAGSVHPLIAFDTPSKGGISSHGRRTRHAPVGARRVYVPLGVMPIDPDPRPDGEDSAQSR